MKRLWPCLFVAVNLGVIGWCWFHTSAHGEGGNLLSPEGGRITLALARLAGLLAAFSALMQLMFIGRVPWIERAFGFDKLTRMHQWNGFVLVACLVVHVALVLWYYCDSRDETPWAQLRDFAENWEGVLAAMIGAFLFYAVLLLSIAIVRQRLKYETWYFSHLAAYAAIALSFGHQTESGGDFTTSAGFTWYWYALNAFVVVNPELLT